MKEIYQSNRFKKDLKLAAKRGCDFKKFEQVIHHLVSDIPLPNRCRPHKLVGDYFGFFECHIEADWLLIYEVGEDYIDLARTGTHADLFK